MTTHSRIAAFLSTSALCLGLAAAPAFAADATAPGETKSQMEHTGKHHKADKTSAEAGSRQARRRQVRQDGQDRQGRRDDARHAGKAGAGHSSFAKRFRRGAVAAGNSKASRYGRREAFPVSRTTATHQLRLQNQVPQAGPRGPASPVRSGALSNRLVSQA